MTLVLELTPEMEAKLLERAAAEGKDPATYAVETIEQKLGIEHAAAPTTPRERVSAWNQFVSQMREHGRRLPPEHHVDDSRESIYEGRGE